MVGPMVTAPYVAECATPVRRAAMVHWWDDLTFLHWRFEREAVQRLLPRGLQVETFDGSAWVGLVPFFLRVGVPRAYWDAGVMMLDISNPASPLLLGHTSFSPGEEGNAHSVAEARGGNILIQADEDINPFVSGVFNGWGYLRIFDISDPSNPLQLSTFATANVNDETVATEWNGGAGRSCLLRLTLKARHRHMVAFSKCRSAVPGILNGPLWRGMD